jgi:site-specific DNA-methyltransferase (cytosine-N4-specific)
MPESVTDRPTKAHEYLFLLAKSVRYYYDAAAIAEPFADERMGNPGGGGAYVRELHPDGGQDGLRTGIWNADGVRTSRNRRTVWTIATEPYAEAHFATFPTALVEPCVLAGSRPGDVVLDPFMGSGTVAQVAQSLGRRWFGTELNPAYAAMQKRRAAQLGLGLCA